MSEPHLKLHLVPCLAMSLVDLFEFLHNLSDVVFTHVKLGIATG